MKINRKNYLIISLVILIISSNLLGQEEGKGFIEGRIFNAVTNEPIPFASIVIWGTNIGSVSDLDGRFLFTGIKPGYIELRASSVGFKLYVSQPILVTNANKVNIEIPMEESVIEIDEITVKASPFRRTEESPVSLRRISIEEIDKNPGGNRDISKVIQSYPGVGSTVSFRNDLIVRGGGAGENRFYLDGVEIPNINHFATQGASGGPVGILNVDFIREVNFYSGAFPANRGNALSSVLEFTQIDGNNDKLKFKGSVGASDLSITLDGPITDKTTYIASYRRSYLQFLFTALELPFLPTYNDFQFKVKSRINTKNEIYFIGLGAYDISILNLKANETEDQRFILSFLPENKQWSYTFGLVYKHYTENGFDTWVLSRNHLNNAAYKYYNNIEVDSLKTLDYQSWEGENKFRYEHTSRYDNGLKLNYGLNFEQAKYTNSTFSRSFANDAPYTINYDSELSLFKWGIFGQVSKGFLKERLVLSLGARMDANSYSPEMNNLLKQFSPRFSASYLVAPRWYLNFNTGRYFQQPPYTMLGYRDNNGTLVNKENGLKYYRTDHLVSGAEFVPDDKSLISLEGFYKWYADYPVSVIDKISLASKGGDFGTVGDEEVLSLAKGQAYGLELFYRNRDLAGFNVIISYTLFRSKSQLIDSLLNPVNSFIPSSWDNKHLLNLTTIRKFKKDWQAGFKLKFLGGAPYTPWDLATSAMRPAWDVRGRGYLDFTQFNTLRLKGFLQLDVRVDKEFYFDRWTLTLYSDIQNILNFKADQPANLYRAEDGNGNPVIINPEDPYMDQLYELKLVQSESGTILPTVGIIVEF
jgi:hypothetical protein